MNASYIDAIVVVALGCFLERSDRRLPRAGGPNTGLACINLIALDRS